MKFKYFVISLRKLLRR